jgi:hypothetical protein
LVAAAGGLTNTRVPHRPDEHHAERADRSLLANEGGPGSRAFDRLSTACRRRGDGKRGFGAPQAAPNEFEAMDGELIREQRCLAKVHWAIVVTGARHVCGVKAEASDAARGKR